MPQYVVEVVYTYRQPVLVEADNMTEARLEVAQGKGRAARQKLTGRSAATDWPTRKATEQDKKWFKKQPRSLLQGGS